MNEQGAAPEETPAEEAGRQFCPTQPLFDIRTPEERQLGIPTGAVSISAADLVQQCRENEGFRDHGGYLICAEGVRSREAVVLLRSLGFHGFSSVAGGFRAWVSAQLPVGYPAGLNEKQVERYARHLVMPQVGSSGQKKLLDARILLVGMGGLNSPVALYLAAAGVGTLGLVDFDTVERSNLQRQIIHGERALGRSKARSAGERVNDLNPDTATVIYEQKITESNAGSLVESWDMVVDGTDNFSSRYALNQACIRQSKPLVYGAVMRFQGQVSVFWPAYAGTQRGPCFRCLFPAEPPAVDTPGCAQAGVLGVLPGIVGTLQATEALKLVLGIGQPLIGSLLMIDALSMEFRKTGVRADPDCPACKLQGP